MRRAWLLLAGLLMTTNVTAQDDQMAVLGSSSGGGGGSDDPAMAMVFERSTALSKQNGRDTPTVEHLLIALLDDKSVQDVLASRYVDVTSLKAQLLSHVQALPAPESGAANQGRDEVMTNVVRRAFIKSIASNRRAFAPPDMLVAILVEGGSVAAQALSEHGLAVDEAEDAALEQYLARAKESDRTMQELQQRIAEQSAQRDAANAPLRAQVAVASSGPVGGPKMYTLRVTSPGDATRFKAAVSHDGRLDLYIEVTPFETEFVGSRIAALFEAIDANARLDVELITEIEGERRTVSGFGGSAGAIFDDRFAPNQQRSGRLR